MTWFGRAARSVVVVVVSACGVEPAALEVEPPAQAVAQLAQPTSLVLGAVSNALAADGTTAVVATVLNADGSLFTARSVPVTFTSGCSVANRSTLDANSTTAAGLASALYQPAGCVGPDVVTARVSAGATTLSATTTVQVSSTRGLSALASLGRTLFFDKALSASGAVSCASCHAPQLGYLATGPSPAPLGGMTNQVIGFRSAPSAAYAALAPPFRYLPATNNAGTVNNVITGKLGTPRGGLMWDGRASTVVDQARGPFLGPHEMANANAAAVRAKVLTRPWLSTFVAVFGATTATTPAATVLAELATAIAQFEAADASFAPFSSKFDAVQRGAASFTAQEANGRAIFSDPSRGACTGCHNSTGQSQVSPGPEVFTDRSYRALAVPRNWRLPYNVDTTAVATLSSLGLTALLNGAALGAPGHRYYDLGFCGPFRTDALLDAPTCGAFKVPGLRNVALKQSYFHNGVYAALADVIHFYVTRDVAPQQIYLKADGTADVAFNDLPVQFQKNREVRPPFTPRPSGPRLTSNDVQDLVTFLCTLTDGYDPGHPAAYRLPLQCRLAVRP